MPRVSLPRAVKMEGITKRKVLKPPSPEQTNRLLREFRNQDTTNIVVVSPADNNLVPNNQGLQRGSLLDLFCSGNLLVHPPVYHKIDPPVYQGINHHAYGIYIQFVCQHVNRLHNRHGPNRVPLCAVTEPNLFASWLHACRNPDLDKQPILDQLTAMKLRPSNFFRVRHIFLLDRSRIDHVGLIVISPQAKAIDYLDAGVPRDDALIGCLFDMLARHLKARFRPHEWKVRQGNSPKQGMTFDCAVYVCLNAMLVALGYPIQAEYKISDMKDRRQRMAIDLLNGADGADGANGANGMFYRKVGGRPVPPAQEEFHYEHTDYWTRPEAFDITQGFHAISKNMHRYFRVYD